MHGPKDHGCVLAEGISSEMNLSTSLLLIEQGKKESQGAKPGATPQDFVAVASVGAEIDYDYDNRPADDTKRGDITYMLIVGCSWSEV